MAGRVVDPGHGRFIATNPQQACTQHAWRGREANTFETMDLYESTVFAGGTFRKYADARIGLMTHGFNYGTGCFEGIRGYWNPEDRELYLLQAREHFERLHNSAKILMMDLPHSVERLVELTREVITRNRFEENVYIRPLLYKSSEEVGVKLFGVPDAFAIVAVPFGRYFDADAGLRTGVSSWRRIDDTMAPARAKITGTYINSALAKSEAQQNGFDEAIMLSADGHVSEGSAANIFVVKNGHIVTPDPSQNVLEGITRRTIARMATEDLGYTIVERPVDRSELYGADEIFLTGSAAGLVFVRSVDHRPIGSGTMGPVARALTSMFEEMTRGRNPKYAAYLTPSYGKREVAV